jgi:hypothetical protein
VRRILKSKNSATPVLKPKEKEFLIKFVASPESLDSIENRVRYTRNRYFRLSNALITLLALTLFAYSIFAGTNSRSSRSFGYGLIVWYAISFFSIYLARRTAPEYWSFKALTSAMGRVEGAIGSMRAATPRKKLARQVQASARCMRLYKPLVPLAFHARITGDEAIRCSQALRQLIRPIMLGADEELLRVKENLASAAINVALTNWVAVGELNDMKISKAVRWRTVAASFIPVLIGFAAPVIAALITALVR